MSDREAEGGLPGPDDRRQTKDGGLSKTDPSSIRPLSSAISPLPSVLRPPSSAIGRPAPAFRFGLVILAAGASTRMGQPKQLLEIDGQPLIVRTIMAALATAAWPVVVVLGANAEKIRPAIARLPVLVVENPAWTEGMAASIRTGVTTLQQFSRALDAALFALCDQPAFSAEIIGRIVEARVEGGPGIVAAHYSGRNGAPALFRHEYFHELAGLTGEEGARALLNGDPTKVTAVDLPALAVDLDTPEDFAALRQNP